MVDTVRTLAEILALNADNATGDISPQDRRDSIVSMFGVYGGIHLADGATPQAGITTTPEKFTGFALNGISSDMTVDHTADSITVGTDGVYFISFEISWSGTGNTTFQFHVRVDGVEQPFGDERRLGAGGDVGSVSFLAPLILSAAEVITIYVETDAGGGASMTASFSQLFAFKLA